MSYETKREALEKLAESYAELSDAYNCETGNYDDEPDYLSEYDAALPDDLPVIPESVGEWLTWCKMSNHSLKDALDGETRVSEDTFARAWVLGVWRVEETGEIVKLEEEK